MSSPLQKREQLSLFRALPGDMTPRNSQDLMAYPFLFTSEIVAHGNHPVRPTCLEWLCPHARC